jgi:hypothetical protein
MTVTCSGPLWDGAADAAVEDVCDDIKTEVGDTGLDILESVLTASIRVNTGLYLSQLVSEDRGWETVINDGDWIYGPWLEGTGSRNAPVTRFGGYHSAVETTGVLNGGVAEAIAETVLKRHLPRMN